LEVLGSTPNHNRAYAGVSIGALVAFLCYIGKTTSELRAIAYDLDFASLQHVDEDTVLGILDTCGIDDGAGLAAFLERLLIAAGFKPSATFGDLVGPTCASALRVYATRLADGVLVEFSRRATPGVHVVDALRASMALPLYFTPVVIDGVAYVDGGLVNNYPMDTLTAAEQRSAVGFLLRKDGGAPFNYHGEEGFVGYAKQLLRIIGIDRYRAQLKRFERQTLLIDCSDIDVLDFSMTRADKERIIEKGAEAMRAFLVKRWPRSAPVRRWSIG
jgi:predicted acylesterase/phospholipase RssA